MVTKSHQAADAELLLELIRDELDDYDSTTCLAALGCAAVEVLLRIPPHARMTVARGWGARLLDVCGMTLPVDGTAKRQTIAEEPSGNAAAPEGGHHAC